MRFLALLKKELRECLPWILLAVILFLGIAGLELRSRTYYGHRGWYAGEMSQGSSVNPYRFERRSPLEVTGVWLFLVSIGLGLVIGIRQFWVPHFTKEWGFTIHRSVKRKTILFAKLLAAVISFAVSVTAIWCLLYWYASLPQNFPLPPTARVFIEGCVLILLGLVVYLGMALSGLSRNQWYTGKMFGLGFAAVVMAFTFMQWQLVYCFVGLIVGFVILLSQLIDIFLKREF